MTTYSIEKLGSDYVVKVDDQQVMKVGSRRRAAQLVVNASELLEEVSLVPEITPQEHPRAAVEAGPAMADELAEGADAAPSITRDSPEVA